MKVFAPVFFSLAISIIAAPVIPTAEGTTWNYSLTEEAGQGLGFSGHAPAENKLHASVAYRISGKQTVDGKELLRFEMHRDGSITNTDLMTVTDRGVLLCGRMDAAGTITKVDPPQPIVAWPLTEGTRWDYDSHLGNAEVHQHYAVVAREDIVVPAGKFRAFKILGEQRAPGSMVVERWVADGVGIVKDVTTTRDADGNLLRRITLELQERPKVAGPPAPNKKPASIMLSTEPGGAATTEFRTSAEQICARWQGHGVNNGAKIRAVWVAENVPDVAPPDYNIDEATATAASPDGGGVFTLGRPENGWAPGDYRVDLYLDDQLVDSAKLKIALE